MPPATTMTPEARSLASCPRHVALARRLARVHAAGLGVHPDDAERLTDLAIAKATNSTPYPNE